jgi:hypothetical protein
VADHIDRDERLLTCSRYCVTTTGGERDSDLSYTTGKLIPLSDYGPRGVSEAFKAGVCTNPTAAFSSASARVR